MRKILMMFCCTLLLFGCSMNSKTESKASQTVAIVAVTSVNTIVYTSKENSDQLKEIEKGFDAKKVQSGQNETPTTDLTLSFINDSGKKVEYNVNYKQNLVTALGGKVYKLDSKTIQSLQEQFMN
ncbi:MULTISPECIES: hypothetical protein [Bacillaceae]|uniref:DUF1307 domain-containing protein n=1 Tax=Gottfriedia luciferensis TaxID=178774 RepID=A0ABX2ZWC9_9BACI|nr:MULTISPECIES: hypothetical protein [Bacillaceae]ODG91368.1 hypothetical protein BED47_06835 [Gottfriedia luciferensis]PGZ92032.1 hypothetical protein COE53_11710 [Bacillus sp. AFS029533]SFD58022.1 hypothetical protein SAMN02799633_04207 [Bacillus sp. UNCCL81]